MINDENVEMREETGTKQWQSVKKQLMNAKVFAGGKKDDEFGARPGRNVRKLFLAVLVVHHAKNDGRSLNRHQIG